MAKTNLKTINIDDAKKIYTSILLENTERLYRHLRKNPYNDDAKYYASQIVFYQNALNQTDHLVSCFEEGSVA